MSLPNRLTGPDSGIVRHTRPPVPQSARRVMGSITEIPAPPLTCVSEVALRSLIAIQASGKRITKEIFTELREHTVGWSITGNQPSQSTLRVSARPPAPGRLSFNGETVDRSFSICSQLLSILQPRPWSVEGPHNHHEVSTPASNSRRPQSLPSRLPSGASLPLFGPVWTVNVELIR